MESNKLYLVMRKRYDESYSKPVAASRDKLTALATCLNLTRSKDIFEFSVLEVPVLDDMASEVKSE